MMRFSFIVVLGIASGYVNENTLIISSLFYFRI